MNQNTFEEYFDRQIRLWGKEKQELLKEKKIAIIGCGGLGCSIGIALGSSGIGEVHLIDFDEISEHNIHRQIAFKVEDENRMKAHKLAELIEDRCPFVKTYPYCVDFDGFVEKEIDVDIIIDATDNMSSRLKIDAYAKSKNIPWVYGSVEEFNGQVCFLEKSSFDAFKAKQMEQKGVAAPMVIHIASLQANLALRYLVGLGVKKDTLYYLHFSSEGELITQKFGMPI